MASIRVLSDGTVAGTRITDENGEPLEGVVAFTVQASAVSGDGLVRAFIEFQNVPLDVTAETSD